MFLDIILLLLPKILDKIERKNGAKPDQSFLKKLFSDETEKKLTQFMNAYNRAKFEYDTYQAKQ